MGRSVRWSRYGRAGVATAAVVLAVSLGATADAAPTAAVPTAASVLQTTRSAIAQQAGAHVVFAAHSGTSSTAENIVADIGSVIGTETLSEGKAHLTIKVTTAFGYVQGNSSGLTTVFGLTAAEAKKAGSHWVTWKAGTSLYSTLKSDVTLASVTALLPKAKGTALSLSDSQLYLLTWVTAATSSVPKLTNTLTIAATGSPLPAKATTTAANGTKGTTTITNWGEKVAVTPPPVASTVPYTKISS
jgi:hypothetical protein